MIRVDHARVFDGERVRDGISVLIDDGLVAAVTPAPEADTATDPG